VVIQPLLFPPEYLKNETDLFFQGIDAKNITESSISLPAGAELSLGTYFNAFSIGRWLEYTSLDNLSLNLKIQGEVKIDAYHAVGSVDTDFYVREQGKHPIPKLVQLVNEKAYNVKYENVDYITARGDSELVIKFKKLYEDGILYITIKAISNAVLFGGYYDTEIGGQLVSPIKLALGICTYKKEELVTGNVSRVIKEIISNPSSTLKDKLEVYVADNGQSLDEKHFDGDKVHILPNPNLGGVGGFTRTMIEAMFYGQAKAFTHIIFMDDDILLYPAVLERTYYLLRMLKPEYQKAILGAGNLLLENPNIQQESGALYKDITLYIGRANHKFFDMRKTDAVAANEVINPTNYTGWWYACVPKTIINEQNLPMPFFIHYDDVEYGIRNIHNKDMFINGISVWHPAPTGKNPFWMTYYDVRNRLITMFSKKLSKIDLLD
jgi:GT2 family glycosyltransferase